MFVDSHCHFHLLKDSPDADAVIAAAEAEGVGHFLDVAVDVEHRDKLVAFAEAHEQVWTSVGVHPSGTGEDPEPDILVSLSRHPKVVAIGETGLDYVYNEGDLEWQRERFRRHVRAARAAGKPVIVHTRGAPEDTVTILREERADEVGGVIHCFTEDWDSARAFMDLNFHISLSGILTFRRAEALRETAARIPLDRLLIETDAPYLAPVPHRGRENRPAWVRHTAECLAKVKGVSLEEVAERTTANFFSLFRPET
jgi:TatD DNase family protein